MNPIDYLAPVAHQASPITGQLPQLALRPPRNEAALDQAVAEQIADPLLKLVYYEVTDDVESAITREKQIKGWLRRKKVALIESLNLYWIDLAEGWDENPTAPQTLRGVYPEPGEILRFAQNDRKRRAQGDIGKTSLLTELGALPSRLANSGGS